MASRLVHAKDDKETIAAWRSDLGRILLIFNVRSTFSAWPLLTVCSQTELAINTHVTVSDIRHNVVDTHTIVSDVHRGVVNTRAIVSELHHNAANTHAIVSDIHRAVGKIPEGTDGPNPSVSPTRTPSATE